MRIALVGNFGPQHDEGTKKICGHMLSAVKQWHNVLPVQTRDFCSGAAWIQLARFRPHCIHYLTGPTIFSLTALKWHRLTLPGPIMTVATGMRPYLNRAGRALLPLIAPDYYLAQARCWQRLFARAGARTRDLPNSVDTECFRPVGPEERRALTMRMGLSSELPVVLHVGHIKENRNLDCLIEVQRSRRYQVWVVGSESESDTRSWPRRLREAGCRVDSHYMPRIEEVYQTADAYVFTVRGKSDGNYPRHYLEIGVIDLPLSILEAMACGLPVVSTRMDAIEHFFADVPGLRFFDGSGSDCLSKLEGLWQHPIATRMAAEQFEYRRVMGTLADIYLHIGAQMGIS